MNEPSAAAGDDPPRAPAPTPLTAAARLSCAVCGGEARWDATRQAVVCAYCGTVAPGSLEKDATGHEVIREHDLAAALRAIPDSGRGWQAAKREVRCQSCQAISVFDPARASQRCDFCGSSALVPHTEAKEAFRPESLLPMKLGEPQVREAIRKWYGSRFWAPNALKRRALTDEVHGLYVPYWTFDAGVHADWTADAGYYYYETETYRDNQGRTQTRRVRRTRWVPASGDLDHFFDDELVAASRGIRADLLRGVEPFPTREVVPYDPKYLSGWVVERYQIDLIAAAQRARDQMESKVRALCAARVPGDTHRNLRVHSRYRDQTFKHILVPVWLLTYDYGRKSYQVVINGFTGAIRGDHPLSWFKIGLAVLGVILLVVLYIALGGDPVALVE